jgi:ferredoxin
MPSKRIAILGTGAASYAAALAFFNSAEIDYQIEVIDFGTSKGEDKVRASIPKSAFKKGHINDSVLSVDPFFHFFTNKDLLPMGSSSFGGWTQMWGATIKPLTEKELLNWPISLDSLSEHHKIIKDELTFQNSIIENLLINPNPRIYSNVNKLVEKFASINQNTKIEFLNSTLAINKFSNLPENGCVQCEKCLSGCEFEHIWTPSLGWAKILKDKRFNYRQDIWLESIRESTNGVQIKGKLRTGEQAEFNAFEYVFVGLGSIQTAALMLRSQFTKEVRIKENRILIVPFFMRRFGKTGAKQKRVSLADAFISNVADDEENRIKFFAQLYGYNEQIHMKIIESINLLRFIPVKFTKMVLQRIGIAMFFLDEKNSNEIVLINNNEIAIREQDTNALDFHKVKKISKESLSSVGLIPLFFLAKLGKTGESYHFGASFPMSEGIRNGNYSDVEGRPNGLKKIAIVDSSIFTDLSPTPPTFNMMANAHRIVTSFLKKY